MKSHDYWKKRAAQVAARQFKSAEEYNQKLLKEYEKAIASIQRDMEVFYRRFADNITGVSMAEARKILDAGQLKEFKLTLEDFIALAKENADGRWTKMLENAYYKQRVTRFEALLTQIRQQIEMLMGSRQTRMRNLMGDTYTDNYYRMVHAIEQGTGATAVFTKLDANKVENVLKMDYEGSNWSKRIWNDRDKLTNEIYTKLSQSFIRGDSIDRTTHDLAKSINSSYKRAYRLTHSEATFFSGQATVQSYRDTGVEKYEFMASHNERTCETCGALDGKVFNVSEQEPGINMQPIHAHCHCSTAPWFEDEFNEKTGEIEDTQLGKTYEDWKRERIDDIGQDEWDQRQKMIQNEASDKAQYQKYKEVLGNETPKTFDKFRDLKYNKAEEWEDTKGLYKYLNKYPESDRNYYKINKEIQKLAFDGKISESIGTAVKPLPINFESIHKHAAKRFDQRGITSTDAQQYIDSAKVMFKQSGDMKNIYYSSNGSASVLVNDKLLITAFPDNYYDDGARAIMEVLTANGK